MWSGRSVTLSLVSQSQSCLQEGCKHFCCSNIGTRNKMYSKNFLTKNNLFYSNKISVIAFSKLPLNEDKRASLDDR